MRLIVLLTLIICQLAQAQVLQWSNPKKLKGAAVFTKVIGENEAGVYILRYRNRFYNKGILIERYRHQLGFQDSRSIELKKSRLIKINLTPKGILLVTASSDRESQKNTVYGQWLNFEMKPMSAPKLILEQAFGDLNDKGNFRVRISDDKKRFALYFGEKSSTGTSILNMKVLDTDFNELNSKRIEIPALYNRFSVLDFDVDNVGNMVMLSRKRMEGLRRKNATYQFNLFVLHADSNNLSDRLLNDSIFLQAPKLSYDRFQNAFTINSFYSEVFQEKSQGVFSLTYHLDSDTHTEFRSDFNDEVFQELLGTKDPESRFLEDFEIIDAIPSSDGGVTLLAEKTTISSEKEIIFVNGVPQSTSKNIYNFDDLLVLSLDNEGFYNWQKVIRKNQTTINDGGYFSSVIVGTTANHLHIIFNDQVRNNGEVIQYSISTAGQMTSKNLLGASGDYVLVIPPESRQVSSNKILLPTSKNRRFSLLKLVYVD